MGFGRLDGRGGDTLLNPFPSSYAGQSWWGLSAIANAGGSQQNPRFIQLSNATGVTLYKITLRNSPLFHVSGSANGFTAWDVKISTPDQFAQHRPTGSTLTRRRTLPLRGLGSPMATTT